VKKNSFKTLLEDVIKEAGLLSRPEFGTKEDKRYYVEYSQDCGFGAVNTACVVIKAKDLKDLHRRLKDKDFGKDDPDHNYCISYYTEIEEECDEFLKNIIKGYSNVDCIIEISNSPDENKSNKEIIDSFQKDDLSRTIVCTEHSNNVLVRAKNLIRDSINSLW
jgi:hypothetical protein